jgi:UDP-glucose 4-epimerase
VTGGAGFIGSHLVDRLLAQGETVRILDDLSTGRMENLESALATGRVEMQVGSVTDLKNAHDAAQGCDRIFHLAATVGVCRVLEDPVGGLRNNILGADSILRAARSAAVRSMVLFSSSEVYGRSTDAPVREDALTVIGPTDVPRWSYAAGKAVGEYLALGEHRRNGLPVTIVRCFNTCGPRQVGSYGMVIPRLIEQALSRRSLTVYGDGLQTRCFSYVGDVVRGVLELSDRADAAGEVFNIGSDEEISILHLAEAIREACDSTSAIEHVAYENAYGPGFEDVQRRVPDLAKIRRWIDYTPQVSLARLLEIARDAMKAQPAPAATPA